MCEIKHIFKGDVIKFCDVFYKNHFGAPQNSQKPLFECKKLVIKTKTCDNVYFIIKCVVRWSENSARFEKSYGKWLADGPNSARFYLTL